MIKILEGDRYARNTSGNMQLVTSHERNFESFEVESAGTTDFVLILEAEDEFGNGYEMHIHFDYQATEKLKQFLNDL